MDLEYYILSLQREDRKTTIEKNLKNFPIFQIFQSINGYNKEETLIAFRNSKLYYHRLFYPTYGTLANFITKYNTIKYQIENKIPFLCFIEDDLELYPNFISYINDNIYILKDKNINMLRLDKWGEGYVTSLSGAINIKNLIDKNGIINNIDNQLRNNCGNEYVLKNTPWKLICETNKGDCLKTEQLDNNLLIKE